ncbi:MAG: rhodanese-like domain-containing protein, partial [Actinomycetota bacterium]
GMVHRIGRDEVQRLAARGTSIVDVLPAKEYRELHLPGAVHIPLRSLRAEAPRRFPREHAIVVYCFDHQ